MSELPESNQRRLFKYYIDQNQAELAAEKKFWYRANRWRFNTRDHSTFPKYFRVKYPLVAAAAALILYDFTYGYKAQEGAH